LNRREAKGRMGEGRLGKVKVEIGKENLTTSERPVIVWYKEGRREYKKIGNGRF